jgi:hypothetical protein
VGSPGAGFFLKPFSTDLWLALIATVVGLAAIYDLLSWATPVGEFEVISCSNVTTNTAVQEYSIGLGELSCLVRVPKFWGLGLPLPIVESPLGEFEVIQRPTHTAVQEYSIHPS